MSLTDTTSPNTDVTVEDADARLVQDNLDLLAHRFLDVSGEHFLRLRETGDLGTLIDRPGFGRVNAVASLLVDARKNAD